MYFHLLCKKRDLFLSVRFCLEGAKTAESEEQDYLQSRGKEKKKGEKKKQQYLFQGKKILDENMQLYPGAPVTSLILCLFLRAMGERCVQPGPRNTQTRGFLSQGKVFFFRAKADTGLLFWKCYGVADLAAWGKAWE